MSSKNIDLTTISGTAYAPATIGNVGPGFDVLGAAVDGLADRITVRFSMGVVDEVSISGRDAAEIPKEPQKNVAVVAAKKLLSFFGVDKKIHVDIHRELPLSGGMGGSAAAAVGAAVAMSRALVALGYPEASERQLLEAALEGESLVAGRHLDNIAPCLFGGLCLVRSVDDYDVVRVGLTDKWWVAMATPNARLETKYARSVLATASSRDVWVNQMAHTSALVHGLHVGDSNLVSRSLVDFYAEPARAPLIAGFNALRAAALGAGALAFTISGAGPTVFALCDSRAAAEACSAAMSLVSVNAVTGGASVKVVTHVGRFGGRGALNRIGTV